MKTPTLTNQQFLDLLKKNGFTVASSEYWEKHNRIMVIRDGRSFPLQFCETYHFPLVVKTCEMLGIDPPEDHKRCYDQVKNRNSKNA